MYPKLISIGGFFLPTYGLLVALGFLAALWMTGRLARRTGLNPDLVTNAGVYAALAGLAGAKLMMFLLDLSYYRAHPDLPTVCAACAGAVVESVSQGGLPS